MEKSFWDLNVASEVKRIVDDVMYNNGDIEVHVRALKQEYNLSKEEVRYITRRCRNHCADMILG